ncbi:MAG: hypothetical protein KAS23_06415 [Anaerohalosphaera sp.]|nr:hypothetical protein [Anaerohalosphaera sp.]
MIFNNRENSISRLRKLSTVLLLFLICMPIASYTCGQSTEEFQPDIELVQKLAVMSYPNATKELEGLSFNKQRYEYSLILASIHFTEFKNTLVAMQFCDYALAIAEKYNFSKGNILVLKGYVFSAKNDRVEAINSLEKASVCFREEKDTDSLKGCLSWLGSTCYNYGDFTRSQESYEELLKLCTDNDLLKAETLFGVGETYYRLNKITMAIDAAEQAKAIYAKTDNVTGLAGCHKLLGNVYMNNNEHGKARECYLKAAHVYENTNDFHGQGNCNFNLGLMSNQLKQYPEAVGHLMKSIYCFTNAASIGGVGIAQMELGRAYYLQNSYGKAELALTQAEYFLKNNSQYRLAQVKEYLGDLKKSQKNIEQSLIYYKASAKLYREVKYNSSESKVQKKIKALTGK